MIGKSSNAQSMVAWWIVTGLLITIFCSMQYVSYQRVVALQDKATVLQASLSQLKKSRPKLVQSAIRKHAAQIKQWQQAEVKSLKSRYDKLRVLQRKLRKSLHQCQQFSSNNKELFRFAGKLSQHIKVDMKKKIIHPRKGSRIHTCRPGSKPVPCYTGDPKTVKVGPCKMGVRRCIDGHWSRCLGEVVPQQEKCDNVDNDCDGDVDEKGACPECKYGAQRDCYDGPKGTKTIGRCRAGRQRCEQGRWGVCCGKILPEVERCDGIDNDCDGKTDELPQCQTKSSLSRFSTKKNKAVRQIITRSTTSNGTKSSWLMGFINESRGEATSVRMVISKNDELYVVVQFKGVIRFKSIPFKARGKGDTLLLKIDVGGKIHWILQIGGSKALVQPKAIRLDNTESYLYLAGDLEGTLSFGTHKVSSNGGFDSFLAKFKLDSQSFEWAISFGSSQSHIVLDLDVDAQNNLHLTGYTNAATKFNLPGESGVVSISIQSVKHGHFPYLIKFDPNGKVLRYFLPKSGNLSFQSLVSDKDGAVYLTGWMREKIELDGSHVADTRYKHKKGSFHTHLYVAKLSSKYQVNWLKPYPTDRAMEVSPTKLAISGQHIFLVGSFFGGTIFSSPHQLRSRGPRNSSKPDSFFLKIDKNGTVLSTAMLGGIGRDEATSVWPDKKGGAYVGGGYSGGSSKKGKLSKPMARSGKNPFVRYLDSTLKTKWTKTLEGAPAPKANIQSDVVDSIVVDSKGSLYVAGRFTGSASFGKDGMLRIAHGKQEGVFLWKTQP